ncbi:MAG: hypothetical protein QOD26_678 [Betaproteobacteria bacterium]|jgi:hypothetical protein|nr:hypothetical protein [Betaproteobacteria bacterium]
MKLEALLRAHGFMRVERPPELWEADTEDTALIPLLGEMIAARLALGGRLEELTLNASNVVVAADDFDDEGRGPAPGEYVALTVMGEGAPEDDATWPAQGGGARSGVLQRISGRLADAGVRYAYTRSFDGKGTITVFLARKA